VFTGLLSHLSLAVALLYVNTSDLKTYVYFVIAGFWGMGDAIWSTNFSGKCRVVLPILLHGRIIKNTLLYHNFCICFILLNSKASFDFKFSCLWFVLIFLLFIEGDIFVQEYVAGDNSIAKLE